MNSNGVIWAKGVSATNTPHNLFHRHKRDTKARRTMPGLCPRRNWALPFWRREAGGGVITAVVMRVKHPRRVRWGSSDVRASTPPAWMSAYRDRAGPDIMTTGCHYHLFFTPPTWSIGPPPQWCFWGNCHRWLVIDHWVSLGARRKWGQPFSPGLLDSADLSLSLQLELRDI